MFLSCVVCVTLFLSLFKEVYNGPKDQVCSLNYLLNLEGVFILAVLSILVISMGSSSMVEEEHYIWHFMVSTFYLLLLFKTVKSFSFSRGLNSLGEYKIGSIFLLLISGRLLRGWHQGGVNWTHFTDISKWLEQAGGSYVKWIQLISSFLVIGLGVFTLFRTESKRKSVRIQAFGFSICGFLILLHAGIYQDDMFEVSTDNGATVTAKVIYLLLSISTVGGALVLPWSVQNKSSLAIAGDCLYLIGSAYVLCWCLLQLLLQQPINSGPILLLLIQILAVSCLSSKNVQANEWVEVGFLLVLCLEMLLRKGHQFRLSFFFVDCCTLLHGNGRSLCSWKQQYISNHRCCWCFYCKLPPFLFFFCAYSYPKALTHSTKRFFLGNL